MKIIKLISANSPFHQRDATFLFPLMHSETKTIIIVRIKQGTSIRRGILLRI